MHRELAEEVASTLPAGMPATRTHRPAEIATTMFQEAGSTGQTKRTLRQLSLQASEKGTAGDQDLFIEYQVGSGGLGVVDAAMQSCLGRRVAVKRVRPDRAGTLAETQLRSEAELMGRLEHPAIPPVYLLGKDGQGHAILVMKLIEGQEWRTILNEDRAGGEKSPDPDLLKKHLRILLRIGDALAFAHEQGVIHRDIKPGNVIVGDYGKVYLLDWGLAAELDEQGIFQAESFAGTPSYAAPEMISTKPTMDVRTDVYLLGATLFHLATGQSPHNRQGLQATFKTALENPTPSPGESVPKPVVAICQKAMAEDPDHRFESVRSMLGAIRHYLDHGETMELHVRSSEDLEQLECMAADGNTESDEFVSLGFRCRYGLERVFLVLPSREVREQLQRCLLLLCDSAISHRLIAAARSLLGQYCELTGDETSERVKALKARIETLADQVVARQDELSMNIQVRLVEQLSKQKNDYDELLAKYSDLRKQQGSDG